MVFIPLRGSGTRGDQVENARLFEKAGAGICFMPGQDEKTSIGDFSGLIASLADDPQRRRAMEEAEISTINSAQYISEEIVKSIKE